LARKLAIPQLSYQADPIRDTLKLLGRKWTLLIIRDIAFLKLNRFGEILRNNPGLTPRVLSRRLGQMTDEGLVRKVRNAKLGKVSYDLTSKGEDAVYILLAILRYGIRHCMGHGAQGKDDEARMIKKFSQDVPLNWTF
jgi:DNA-binding HxlR family transcriptional regulator